MTPKKNTPTPWKTPLRIEYWEDKYWGKTWSIIDSDGTAILIPADYDYQNCMDESFAKAFVKCVNEREALKQSHKELLEAVIAARDSLIGYQDIPNDVLLRILEKAIQNAKEVEK